MYKIISLVLIIISFAFVGCIKDDAVTNSPSTAQESEQNGDRAPVIVAQEAKLQSTPGGKYVSLPCRFTNPSEHVVSYTGYKSDSFDPPLQPGRISPIYKTMYKHNGKWQTFQHGWCGVGMAHLDFESGASAGFDVILPDQATAWAAVKVGFNCSWINRKGEKTSAVVWSNEVAFEDIDK
jgi:hypothetical protein